MLKDANNVTLGKVLSVGTSLSGVEYTPQHFAFVTIQTSTKHIISMGLDGVAAFGQVYWNGGGCGSGQAILNTGTSSASRKGFCKLVVRTASGALMSTGSGCDANGLVDSVQIAGVTNIESTGSCSGSSSTNFGFLLTTVANTDIGLPASIALPLSY